jgi:hypothetical protein
MNANLKDFIKSYMGVVLMTLLPIALTAFLSIPYSLGGHPGDVRSTSTDVDQHMT